MVNNRHVYSQVKISQLLRSLNFKTIQVFKFLSLFILSRTVDLQFTWSSHTVSIVLRRHFFYIMLPHCYFSNSHGKENVSVIKLCDAQLKLTKCAGEEMVQRETRSESKTNGLQVTGV